jgi:hypothetical protein
VLELLTSMTSRRSRQPPPWASVVHWLPSLAVITTTRVDILGARGAELIYLTPDALDDLRGFVG